MHPRRCREKQIPRSRSARKTTPANQNRVCRGPRRSRRAVREDGLKNARNPYGSCHPERAPHLRAKDLEDAEQ